MKGEISKPETSGRRNAGDGGRAGGGPASLQGGVPERGCRCQCQHQLGLGWGCRSRWALTKGAARGTAQVSTPLRPRVQHGRNTAQDPRSQEAPCSSWSWQAKRPGPASARPHQTPHTELGAGDLQERPRNQTFLNLPQVINGQAHITEDV